MTTDTSRTLEIEGSPRKLLGLVGAGVAMTAASLAVALPLFDGMPTDPVAKVVGWFGVVFFGLCTVVAAWRLIAVRGPVLTMAPYGIRDTRIARDFIPWTAVQRISTWQFGRQKAMVLAVDPAMEVKLGLTPMARWTRSANRALGADGLCITALGLKIDYATLFQIATDYANAARSASAARIERQ